MRNTDLLFRVTSIDGRVYGCTTLTHNGIRIYNEDMTEYKMGSWKDVEPHVLAAFISYMLPVYIQAEQLADEFNGNRGVAVSLLAGTK